jgi:hypothetical protein
MHLHAAAVSFCWYHWDAYEEQGGPYPWKDAFQDITMPRISIGWVSIQSPKP